MELAPLLATLNRSFYSIGRSTLMRSLRDPFLTIGTIPAIEPEDDHSSLYLTKFANEPSKATYVDNDFRHLNNFTNLKKLQMIVHWITLNQILHNVQIDSVKHVTIQFGSLKVLLYSLRRYALHTSFPNIETLCLHVNIGFNETSKDLERYLDSNHGLSKLKAVVLLEMDVSNRKFGFFDYRKQLDKVHIFTHTDELFVKISEEYEKLQLLRHIYRWDNTKRSFWEYFFGKSNRWPNGMKRELLSEE
ncbi:hypothetical protein E3Q18_04329 [Wallemia mellicola]|nr:hypothetical protein E3Q19_04236 [Wallemia mellicola]TIB94154.1 hypothetical protein E3Q18_04329 [Wallemia mellicola]TIB99265.1 hypothetical protein E3Q16_04203 [Wallemia mellicola]TIC07018.1 hypothetical protein E3Q14_04366 [Wallemia mellicola]TIC07031.1 hypothetical protein E3Q15_04287 [Wallemia mellicola]